MGRREYEVLPADGGFFGQGKLEQVKDGLQPKARIPYLEKRTFGNVGTQRWLYAVRSNVGLGVRNILWRVRLLYGA